MFCSNAVHIGRLYYRLLAFTSGLPSNPLFLAVFLIPLYCMYFKMYQTELMPIALGSYCIFKWKGIPVHVVSSCKKHIIIQSDS